jgi:hypothetical protein
MLPLLVTSPHAPPCIVCDWVLIEANLELSETSCVVGIDNKERLLGRVLEATRNCFYF